MLSCPAKAREDLLLSKAAGQVSVAALLRLSSQLSVQLWKVQRQARLAQFLTFVQAKKIKFLKILIQNHPCRLIYGKWPLFWPVITATYLVQNWRFQDVFNLLNSLIKVRRFSLFYVYDVFHKKKRYPNHWAAIWACQSIRLWILEDLGASDIILVQNWSF